MPLAGQHRGRLCAPAAASYDRYLDLFTLRFDLARRAPELGQWLAGLLRGTAPDEVLLACWAHMSLRLVDWSIRHFSASHVTSWLEVAEALRP